jgi:hypothetical protein
LGKRQFSGWEIGKKLAISVAVLAATLLCLDGLRSRAFLACLTRSAGIILEIAATHAATATC